MTQPNDKYKTSAEWAIVEKALDELISNQDIALAAKPEYVIGHISKQFVENKAHTDLRVKVILSANKALWGAVTQNLRAITVNYDPAYLVLRAYFDKGATAQDKELIDIALSEMAADLWQDIEQYRFEAIDLPFPGKMDNLKDWIYKRHEALEAINVG